VKKNKKRKDRKKEIFFRTNFHDKTTSGRDENKAKDR
jgi:hypothetical protein